MQERLTLSNRQCIARRLKSIDFELKSELLSERGLIRISGRSPYENEMRIFLNRSGVWVRSVYKFFIILSAFLAIRFLNLTILQNHPVNILSTINTFPHPKVFGFIINLFVNHHAATTVAFRKSFPHPPPPLEREGLVRIVELKIPGATILSI